MKSIKNWKKASAWLLYLPVAAYVLYLSSQYLGSSQFALMDYGLFLVLAFVVGFFPVRTQDSVFSLVNGVSLAILIVYGLVPEMFLSSIAILAVLIRSDVRWDQHYRYPINLLATIIISLMSSLAYYGTLALLNISNLAPLNMIPMVAYMMAYILTNQSIAVVLEKYYYKFEDVQFFDENLKFTLKTCLLILPLSYILIYLYTEMGTMGIVIGAFPFLTTSIVTKYYYRTQSNNMILTEVTRYSQMIATKETRTAVINSFMEYILKIFPSEQVYYFRVTKKKFAVLDRVFRIDELNLKGHPDIILTEESPLMKVFTDQKMYVFDKAIQWRKNAYHNPHYTPESAIALPVRLMGKNKGIIVITHHHRAIYDEFLVTLIEIFYQYFRVVLDNAYQFERLEDSNFTDYLTNLPNLRGFAKYFEEVAANNTFETLSLLVMDLDHFKHVNDIHGHEAGNDVLIQVADVLRKFTNKDCFASRFGGEEFMLLVQDLSQSEAYQLAEDVRKKIEETVYKVSYSIETEKEAEVKVTASLGISTYPDDAKDIHDLVKLADRAMYLGSKQNGRNKTTMHSQESSRVTYDEAIFFKDE